MIVSQIIAAVAPTTVRSLRRWIFKLGGLGLIPLGILDNSIIPLPGSMDVALIILCARQEQWWFYYALMATAGSIIGGFVTYRIARKGGKEALKRKLKASRADKIIKIFERWGFSAIAVPALLPPPVPITPFLIAAGAMQYPVKKFLAALSLGRIARYTIFGYLAASYGRRIIGFITEHQHPLVLIVVCAAVVGALLVLFFLLVEKRRARTAN